MCTAKAPFYGPESTPSLVVMEITACTRVTAPDADGPPDARA